MLVLIRRIRLIIKFIMLQPVKQAIPIHILRCILNISKSKSSQAVKFGKLIAYNTRNIFLEKSYTKCGGETIPRHFSISFYAKL